MRGYTGLTHDFRGPCGTRYTVGETIRFRGPLPLTLKNGLCFFDCKSAAGWYSRDRARFVEVETVGPFLMDLSWGAAEMLVVVREVPESEMREHIFPKDASVLGPY